MKNVMKKLISLWMAVILVILMLPVSTLQIQAASVTGLTVYGLGVTEDDNTYVQWDASGDSLNCNLPAGQHDQCGGLRVTYCRLKNERAVACTLSFDYYLHAGDDMECTIDGVNARGSGHFSKLLQPGEEVEIYMQANFLSAASGSLTNIRLTSTEVLDKIFVSVEPSEIIYGGSFSTSYYGDGLSKIDQSSLTSSYRLTGTDGAWTEDKALGVGTWDVRVSRKPDDTYDAYEWVLDSGLVVTPAPAPEVIFPTTDRVVFTSTLTLADIPLVGGSTELGSFAWTQPETPANPVVMEHDVTFTPSDEALQNYTGLEPETRKVAVSYKFLIQEQTPAAAVDVADVTLSGLQPNQSYTINGIAVQADANGKLAVTEEWMGTTIQIVKPGDLVDTLDSLPQSLVVPARAAAPTGVTATAETYEGMADGKISGVDPTMEYSLDGNTWTSITSTQLVELAPGTYSIRVKCTVETFASLPVTVEVEKGAQREYHLVAGDNDFGSVYVGGTVDSFTVEVENRGSQTASVTSAALGTDAFVLTGPATREILSGATDTSWSVQPKTGLAPGTYRDTLTLTYNNGLTAAAEFTVTVKPAPVAITQDLPAGMNMVVREDKSLMLTVETAADAPAVQYIWYLDGAAISGANEATLSLSALQVGTCNIRCVITCGDYTIGSGTCAVEVERRALTKADFDVDTNEKVYNGAAIEPEVKAVNPALTANDYTVTYGENIETGTGTITITGKGDCQGILEYTFVITKAEPVVTWPTGLSGHAGEKLSTITLPEGFSWMDGASTLTYGENSYPMVYTPADTEHYHVLHQNVTVQGMDQVAPIAQISLKDDNWMGFQSSVIFDLYINKTNLVTIAADDAHSGVDTIEYHLAQEAMTREALDALAAEAWNAYTQPVSLTEEGNRVLYARITDKAGNVLIISTDGLVVDNTAPAITGVADGSTYYGDVAFDASDANLDTVLVDGAAVVTNTILADNARHTVKVTDKAGNVTEYTFLVCKNYTVTFVVDGKTVSQQTVGYGQDAVLPELPAKEGYTAAWSGDGKAISADTAITAVYTKIQPTKPADPSSPGTGDPADLMGFGALLLGSLAALAVLLSKKKKLF